MDNKSLFKFISIFFSVCLGALMQSCSLTQPEKIEVKHTSLYLESDLKDTEYGKSLSQYALENTIPDKKISISEGYTFFIHNIPPEQDHFLGVGMTQLYIIRDGKILALFEGDNLLTINEDSMSIITPPDTIVNKVNIKK